MGVSHYKTRLALLLLKGLDALIAPLVFITVREQEVFGQFINLSTLERIHFTGWHFVSLIILAIILNLVFTLSGMYRLRDLESWPRRLFKTALAATMASAFVLLGVFVVGITGIPESTPVLFWISTTLIFLIQRSILFLALDLYRRRGKNAPNAVIVGLREGARELSQRLGQKGAPYRIVGYLGQGPPPEARGSEEGAPAFLGDLDRFGDYISRNPVDVVLVALPFKTHYHQILGVIQACATQGIKTRVVTDLFDLPPGVTYSIDTASGVPLITYATTTRSEVAEDLKRLVDLVCSALALIALLPVFALVSLLIMARDGRPVLFVQDRVGLNKRLFRMFKFRTMVKDAEALLESLQEKNEIKGAAFKMTHDPRITRVGRFLRKTSLDETPQFINSLLGSMSLVGPRPLTVWDFERFYSDTHRRRFAAKPGLTGLWQVSGRSDIDFDEWMKLDVFYVDNWSLLLDLRILIQTVRVVLTMKGAR